MKSINSKITTHIRFVVEQYDNSLSDWKRVECTPKNMSMDNTVTWFHDKYPEEGYRLVQLVTEIQYQVA